MGLQAALWIVCAWCLEMWGTVVRSGPAPPAEPRPFAAVLSSAHPTRCAPRWCLYFWSRACYLACAEKRMNSLTLEEAANQTDLGRKLVGPQPMGGRGVG